jgi:hypothetical protein
MGKVIIKFKDNHLESFKCKSKERASEIAGKRPNVIEWNYYNDGERIPKPKKKVVEKMEMTLEQMERLISRF